MVWIFCFNGKQRTKTALVPQFSRHSPLNMYHRCHKEESTPAYLGPCGLLIFLSNRQPFRSTLAPQYPSTLTLTLVP